MIQLSGGGTASCLAICLAGVWLALKQSVVGRPHRLSWLVVVMVVSVPIASSSQLLLLQLQGRGRVGAVLRVERVCLGPWCHVVYIVLLL